MRVELAPSIGGSIARFYSETSRGQHHWLRPATNAALLSGDAEGMASFPLVPFCNRIRNGRAHFQGREIRLPPNRGNSPHTIHGFGWQHPWNVREHDEHSAVLEFVYAGGDWPYPFRATQHYRLSADRLDITMEVKNNGPDPMPLGLGHHPYLPNRRAARLTVAVAAMWGGDEEVMPTEIQQPPLLARLRDGVALSEVIQDNNFIGWQHSARVDWPALDGPATGLVMQAASPLDYFVLYSPAEHDFFCIEAVSNCTDWLNLKNVPKEQVGGSIVAPGEKCKVHFSLMPFFGNG
ncbi:MAG: aldose 1-epimerase [Herminiimonas sp.]|nr:aldose 1-epimerase [Herminiimonas sp.]